MGSKYSYEDISNYFKEQGCKLLETEYKNNNQDLNYICSCGNKSITKFKRFKRGHRCKKCGLESVKNKLSYSYQEVLEIFEKKGCTLLSDSYNGIQEKLSYICSCGNKSEISLTNFLSGSRCKKCGREKQAKKRSHNYEYVYKTFAENGCQLLSTTYKNIKTYLDYICSCGHESKITFENFQRGDRCNKCRYIRSAEKLAHTYEYVFNYFKDNNCLLLSKEYKTMRQKLEYICECGQKDEITFGHFLRSQRCRKCGLKKYSGENNPNWNGGISTLLSYLRSKIYDWKFESMKKYNFKCAVTGKDFEVVHHLYGFNKIFEEFISTFNIPIYEQISLYSESDLEKMTKQFLKLHYKYGLGVPLTKEIHLEFHRIYGYGDNTPQQFEEFKRNYTKSPQGDFFISNDNLKVVNNYC